MKRIYINARSILTEAVELTYQQIVDLADSGRSKNCFHSVIYDKGYAPKYQGQVCRGQTVRVREGMRISAYVTDSA